MGIPSYFYTIIKQNPNIIKSINKLDGNIDNLYLDSNSIIYDCYHKIKDNYDPLYLTLFEKSLIEQIIEKINNYRKTINPKRKIGIFFDGPAPLCKLEQQRSRRHRVIFEKNIKEKLNLQTKSEWNTTSITPGTKFMDKLNEKILDYYKNDNSVLISTSDEVGEGEHKIFNYIRNNNEYHNETTSIIYGLDADLIMLTLNHLPITKTLYLSREAPHFSKELNITNMDELMFLDIPKLSRHIINEMKNKGLYINKNIHYKTLLDDYILMCFLLGNDFLPHFPILSIRSGGIDILLNHYKYLFNKNNYTLTSEGKINWNNFRKFINSLANEEEKMFCEVHKNREKQSYHIKIPETKDQKMTNLNYIPIKNREIENMINPFKHNWEYRYYKYLFDIEIDSVYRKKISLNYLQGIEWVFDYYTKNCENWRWKYNYSYPPLLSDLINYIPCYNSRILPEIKTNTFSPYVQLSYVLPKECHNELLPIKYCKKIRDNFSHYYTDDPNFRWSYCKFFWESHIELPDIDINKLEEILI
jgi:5'-3' exoribonuclease 1